MIDAVLNDWPGWLLIVVTFCMIYKFWKMKKDKYLTFALSLILLSHHCVAMIDTYFYVLPGAEGDPSNFQYLAKSWAENGKLILSVGATFYTQLLGLFYRIFIPSEFFGSELSVFVFFLSCLVFIEILELLNISKYTMPLLLLYGLLPTYLIFCSKILRESYEIFFLMLSIYWALQYHINPTKKAVILCVLSALTMGFFHRALIIYQLFLVVVLFLWHPKQISWNINGILKFCKQKLITISVILIFILSIIGISILWEIGDIEALKSFLTGKGWKYAADYRTRLIFEEAPDARANYGILFDATSAWSLIKSTSLIYIYYLFAPFPWQVSNSLDIYALAESFLRFVLLLSGILFWYRAKGNQKSIGGLFLCLYFTLTFLWAMGTVNYGQSIRHHLLTNWMIMILGGPGLIDFIIEKARKIFPRVRLNKTVS